MGKLYGIEDKNITEFCPKTSGGPDFGDAMMSLPGDATVCMVLPEGSLETPTGSWARPGNPKSFDHIGAICLAG